MRIYDHAWILTFSNDVQLAIDTYYDVRAKGDRGHVLRVEASPQLERYLCSLMLDVRSLFFSQQQPHLLRDPWDVHTG